MDIGDSYIGENTFILNEKYLKKKKSRNTKLFKGSVNKGGLPDLLAERRDI